MRITPKIRCACVAVTLLALGVERLPAQSAPSSSAVAATDTVPLQARGAWDGARAASQRSIRGAFLGGVGSGLAAPIYGLFIAWPVAGRPAAPDAAGRRAMTDSTPRYDAAFRASYEKELKSRRRSATVRGHLLGSIPWIVLVILMSDS